MTTRSKSHSVPAPRAGIIRWSGIVAALMLLQTARPAAAQTVALAATARPAPVVEYTANESGGRIALSLQRPDSAGLEGLRAHLIESAAAIRRGDYRNVRFIPNEGAAVEVLAGNRGALRCTVRSTARGAELVLLSDDDSVIAAIHQILAGPPPQAFKL